MEPMSLGKLHACLLALSIPWPFESAKPKDHRSIFWLGDLGHCSLGACTYSRTKKNRSLADLVDHCIIEIQNQLSRHHGRRDEPADWAPWGGMYLDCNLPRWNDSKASRPVAEWGLRQGDISTPSRHQCPKGSMLLGTQ